MKYDYQPTKWEEPEELPLPTVTKNISYFLNADEEEFDVAEALTFLKDMKMELAIHYATIEALKKLEKKIKDSIRLTGEIPDVPNTVIKFGKKSTRTYVHTKMLQEMATRDPVPEARDLMVDLAPHVHTSEGGEILKDIQVLLSKHLGLEKYLYTKDISPSIKIEV